MACENTADIIDKNIMSIFKFPCSRRHFAGVGEFSVCHSVVCLFISGSYDQIQVSSIASILETKLFSSISKRKLKLGGDI